MKRLHYTLIFCLLLAACGDGSGDLATSGATRTSSKTVLAAPVGASPVTTTKARIYLGVDDTFTVSNSGATVYGGAGADVVTITNGVSAVVLDQNIEQVVFSSSSSTYAFQQTGNKINIYDATGTTLLVSIPVQGDADGTLFTFSDGTVSALLSGGIMTLGGVTVSATTATSLALFQTQPTSTGSVTVKW